MVAVEQHARPFSTQKPVYLGAWYAFTADQKIERSFGVCTGSLKIPHRSSQGANVSFEDSERTVATDA
jgi:hypothetical protein